jgi:glucokinase
LINLNDVKPTPNKMKVVMTPGTGLGVSFLVPYIHADNTCEYVVWQSEAAHANFAP